jgi:hypothetical protein
MKTNSKIAGTVARIRGLVAKAMLVGVAACALMIASPVKAQAQEIVVGVRAGAPFYGPRAGFGFERRQEFLRREVFLRHEEWLRAQRFHGRYGYR